MSNLTFLLTGATGFLGNIVVRELVNLYGPESVSCLVPHKDNSVRVHSASIHEELAQERLKALGVRVFEGNLQTFPVFSERVSFDVLIHLAADNRQQASFRELLAINRQGTSNLLRTLGDTLAGKLVIFTSTILAMDRNSPATEPLSEKSPTCPQAKYGKSKLEAERVIRHLAEEYQYTYVILRLTSLYGPGMRAGLIYDLTQLVKTGSLLGRINWYGKTSALFVDDAARVVTWFARQRPTQSDVFLVAGDPCSSVGRLLEEIRSVSGINGASIRLTQGVWSLLRKIIWKPGIRWCVPWKFRHIVDNGLECDVSKLLTTTQLTMTPLRQGLAKTLPSIL
jgi:nucleoside-diphosphate-sugar epimerase